MYEWIWGCLLKMIFPHMHILQGQMDLGSHLAFVKIPPTNENVAISILVTAMECLHYHFNGTKVIVLVDEFDAPLNNAVRKGYYEVASQFFLKMFSLALKGNSALKKACLVGIVSPLGAGILSNLNNIGVFSVANKQFSKHFGFTHDEISTFLGHNTCLA
jgi:hypothetical protein